MTNVEARIEENRLIIEIDLNQQSGYSASGKSLIIASTQGNVPVPGRADIQMGLNVYQPQRRSR